MPRLKEALIIFAVIVLVVGATLLYLAIGNR